MDTDFHYLINIKTREVNKNTESVFIGEQSWIGSWVVIKKGAKIPNNTIVAGPYSMIAKDYRSKIEKYSVIAGCPAKIVASGLRRISNQDSENQIREHYRHKTKVFISEESNNDIFCLPQEA